MNGASVGSSAPGAGNAGPLITIADLSQMKVNVQINEVDISRIAVDQKAQVSFTALRDLYCDAVVTTFLLFRPTVLMQVQVTITRSIYCFLYR